MNLKCLISGHLWKGCQCDRCGLIRDQDHDWAGTDAKCARCGKAQPAAQPGDHDNGGAAAVSELPLPGSELAVAPSPEEVEAKEKEKELLGLEAELAQSELDLATLVNELAVFEANYLRAVGARYAELDAIKARLAALRARQIPADEQVQEQAREAQARAEESAREAAGHRDMPEEPAFTPSDDLKSLYRKLAKRLHPDLATDEAERERRHHLMAEVNRAYKNGDEARLREIFAETELGAQPAAEKGWHDVLAGLVLKLERARQRIDAVKKEITALRESAIYRLHERARQAEKEGRDLFAEMVAEIDREIADLTVELKKLEAQSPDP